MVSLQELPAIVLSFVVGGMILGAGALSLNAFNSSLTAGQTASMAVLNTTVSVANIAAQLPTVGTIVGVALIIMVIVGAFGGALRKSGE